MNNRLKELRADKKMTTRAFGEVIGISGGAVTNMEKGTRNITDRTVTDICREFNVNETWLRTGEGEMYNAPSKDDVIENLAKKYGLNETGKQIIKTFCELPESSRNVLEKFLEQLVEAEQQKPIDANVIELHSELQDEDADEI